MSSKMVGSSSGLKKVEDSGTIVLAGTDTLAELSVGSLGGKLRLILDNSVKSFTGGENSSNGTINIKFPKLTIDQKLRGTSNFTIGIESFKLQCQITGHEDESGYYSSVINYTIINIS